MNHNRNSNYNLSQPKFNYPTTFTNNSFKFNKNLQNKQTRPTRPDNGYSQSAIKEIIDYIYCSLDLGNYKYSILEYDSQLSSLTQQKYYVSANFVGTNNLLIFIKIRQNFYSCMIDRKTLAYRSDQVKLDQVKIFPINTTRAYLTNPFPKGIL